MWKKQALIIQKEYPFGIISNSQAYKYSAKKKLTRGQGHLQKTKILSTLKHDSLIKIQGVQQQNGQYYIVYQYIAQSIEKWYSQVNRQYIQNYEQRLILLSRYLTDKGIIIAFRRQNMGATDIGQPKYYLDTTFTYNLAIDKLAQKKKYKQEIRSLIQYYLDRNMASKANITKKIIHEKKQNSKILKILEAIEKGKANLCSDSSKDQVALNNHNSKIVQKSSTNKITNFHNVFIQKQVNHINKIQVIIGNNKPVEVIQQEFKRQYASSSFYLNGIQTAKFEKQSQARRLLSPNDKYNKYQEVNFKQYKNMKASGELYVQDFISVLQAQQMQKNTLGSPRVTMHGPTRAILSAISKKINQQKLMITDSISQQEKSKETKSRQRQQKKLIEKKQQIVEPKQIKKIIQANKHRLSETLIKLDGKQQQRIAKGNEDIKVQSSSIIFGSINNNRQTSDIQKKVNQAIANSLNAINRIKNGKVSQVCI